MKRVIYAASNVSKDYLMKLVKRAGKVVKSNDTYFEVTHRGEDHARYFMSWDDFENELADQLGGELNSDTSIEGYHIFDALSESPFTVYYDGDDYWYNRKIREMEKKLGLFVSPLARMGVDLDDILDFYEFAVSSAKEYGGNLDVSKYDADDLARVRSKNTFVLTGGGAYSGVNLCDQANIYSRSTEGKQWMQDLVDYANTLWPKAEHVITNHTIKVTL